MRQKPRKSKGRRDAGATARDKEAVRRAVAGTLNREVDTEVVKQPGPRWAITLVVNGQSAPAISIGQMEMKAMRQVPLVPAHLRGHFLRNYAALTKRPE